MMKILYVAHNIRDASKGAAYADISLLDELRRRGHLVEERWDIGSPRRIRHDNLHLLLEAPGRCRRTVADALHEAEFDVVLVNQPLGYRVAELMRRRPNGGLYVARTHGWEPFVAAERRRWGEWSEGRSRPRRIASRLLEPGLLRQNRLVLEGAHGIVLASEDDRRGLVDSGAFPGERTVVIEPGLPVEFREGAPAAMTPERARRVLHVGQFVRIKAPAITAVAIARILESNSSAEATWVCEAVDHEAVRSLFPCGVRGRLRLLPWLSRRELVEVYDRHGIFVFPSYYEGFGQTFLEAMARGLVVLASEVGGMKQTIRSGEDGYLFAPGDASGIAVRALELQRDPARLSAIGRKASAVAATRTWEHSAAKLESFLLRLIAMETDRLTRRVEANVTKAGGR